jgi:hypothetical protein
MNEPMILRDKALRVEDASQYDTGTDVYTFEWDNRYGFERGDFVTLEDHERTLRAITLLVRSIKGRLSDDQTLIDRLLGDYYDMIGR